MRIKCCPSCGSMAIGFGQVLRPLSRRPVSSGLLPHRWFLICHDCHYDPFVMVYNKPSAPHEIKRLQRWCNNRFVFKKCPNFEDYDTSVKSKKGKPDGIDRNDP